MQKRGPSSKFLSSKAKKQPRYKGRFTIGFGRFQYTEKGPRLQPTKRRRKSRKSPPAAPKGYMMYRQVKGPVGFLRGIIGRFR